MSKLEAARGTSASVDLYEEFRILTLRVIGEAVLGLSHDDSDAVFPKLYLPIMEEGNRNSLEPWRSYIPWIVGEQRARIGKLNAYIIGAPLWCLGSAQLRARQPPPWITYWLRPAARREAPPREPRLDS